VPPATPQEPRKKWPIFLILVAIVGGFGYYFWQSRQAATGGGHISSIQTVAADMGNVDFTIRINGTIAAKNQYSIMAPRMAGSRSDTNRGGSANMQGGGGRGSVGGGGGGAQGLGASMMTDFSLVLIKLAPAGSRVKAGDVIAEFDPQMQKQRMDDYKDALAQQNAQINSRLANLAESRESHLLRVQQAEAAYLRALQDQKTVAVVSDVQKQLYNLAVEENKAKYDQLQAEDDLVDQQQQAQLKSLQLTRDQANVEYKRALSNITKLTMRAPADGIVVMASIVRNQTEFGQVREGDEVRAGMPFMYIVDANSMVLNGTVNQVDAERLRLGMKARIRLDAYGDIEVPGTLEGLGALSKTSTFRAGYVSEIPVRVSLDKMDPRIIPDLTGSAEVLMQSEQNAVVLPRSAVFEESGGKFVFLQGPQGWIRKQVETGVASYTHVAVHSGVRKGEVVALQRPM
jgi:HlyD family secretion protein